MVTNKQLANIAVYGAVGCISAVMYMRYKITERIGNEEYFKKAFQILRQHPGAVSLLGEPIKQTGLDIGNKTNFCDGHSANFEVQVRGPKDRGTMYFTAKRSDETGWDVKRVELAIKSQPDKRLLVKNELD